MIIEGEIGKSRTRGIQLERFFKNNLLREELTMNIAVLPLRFFSDLLKSKYIERKGDKLHIYMNKFSIRGDCDEIHSHGSCPCCSFIGSLENFEKFVSQCHEVFEVDQVVIHTSRPSAQNAVMVELSSDEAKKQFWRRNGSGIVPCHQLPIINGIEWVLES